MNNTKITYWLKQGKVEKAFTKLYKLYPKVELYVLQNSGSKEEALDIFQEGLILLYHKSKTDQNLVADGFLIKSCKYLWQNELRKKKVRGTNGAFSSNTKKHLDNLTQDDAQIEALIEKENQLKKLEGIIKKISKKCRDIFQMFYFKSMSMAEIAKKIGYKSVQSAKVQKYKCMEKARNLALMSVRVPTDKKVYREQINSSNK